MAIRITLECGHASVLRVRTTPEGYTHDWEVFVRGVDNADISQYIEKVVFQLHETFPKPKRILKEPPYVVKESGYAGFVIPIYICFKNKDEPKRIQILYDLQLQQSGPAINNFIRQSEIFTNPADDFRRKLLKGGGVIVSNPDEGPDKGESKVAVPMVGKPKLSGTDGKKHRVVEPKTTDTFAGLFGTPIKTAKVSPENKKVVNEKVNYHKISPDKPEKSEKLSKTKHSPHKDGKRERNGDEKKEKRERDQSKDKERSKEKSKRPPSPSSKNSYQSPSNKRPQSPTTMKKPSSPVNSITIRKSASPKIRDKDHKKMLVERDKDREKERTKDSTKSTSDESKSDKKKKKHREDKDAERKDRVRDKERDKLKEMKSSEKKNFDKLVKHDRPDKEKSQENKSSKDVKKSPKPSKESERSNTKTISEKSEISEKTTKDTTRTDRERQKHKHRKKEKKDRTDESKDREKRDKRDKQVNSYEKDSAASAPPTLDPPTTLVGEVNDRDSSDSANSADEEDSKNLTSCKTDQEVVRNAASDSRLSRPLSPSGSEHVKKVRPEKMKKDKLKPLRGEERDSNRKRKRRSDSKGVDDELPTKREKDIGFSPPLEPVSSSQSPVIVETSAGHIAKESEEVEHHAAKPQEFETETEHIAPDSTNSILVESESDEPLVFSEDYVSQLKDLQHKIMTLQDNQELQRVVQVIAATGQYEITRKTFDFDLCALDRRTVQRLQQFFSAS